MVTAIHPLHPGFAIVIGIIAALTALALLRLFPQAPHRPGRVSSLDGLRGFLALGVFVHHAAIWYFYSRTGKWEIDSHLYVHLGKDSAGLFFMITSFLFLTKLLDAGRKPVSWLHLYTSRILRLAPLYFCSIALLLALVFTVTGPRLQVPLPTLLRGLAEWLSFTMFGAPDLNGLRHTYTINAGVAWSLPYEWFFYAILPLLALILALPRRWMIVACLAIVGGMAALSLHNAAARTMMSFGGGIVAAIAFRYPPWRRICGHHIVSVLVLALFGLALIGYPGMPNVLALLLISTAFVPLACGNSLFGALTCAPMRFLGDIAYGVYLLHGIVLFIAFYCADRMGLTLTGSVAGYWASIAVLTIPLLVICHAAYTFVELPAMASVPQCVARLRKAAQRLPGARQAKANDA
ncbi:acyltransferase family protein [Janthinobacterium fluminis]|uniref:Acyltransferase n=1 Tax=Janthinobacterium fluminis TaxID=2987524 RepID=A0ABT5K326_9BURK|nr:acyltransferase [Janthinobacterium fluminis]MDC8759269.1 acyltransferase [Janthinobacterium fluminis]